MSSPERTAERWPATVGTDVLVQPHDLAERGAAGGGRGPVLTFETANLVDLDGGAARETAIAAVHEWVLDQDLFRSALIRERKRADRHSAVFAVVTLDLGRGSGGAVALDGGLAQALRGATRDTDIVGWVEQDAVLGVILADVAQTAELAERLEDRVRQQVEACQLPPGSAAPDVRIYVHAGPGGRSGEAFTEEDPLLQEVRLEQARRLVAHALKRLLDIVGSVVLLVLLSPLLLLIAVLVKLTSPGPVLFKQTRIGHLAAPFTMLKFRSMQHAADPALHRQYVTAFIRSGGQRTAASGELYKIQGDPRVTPLGRLLRRSSLDELPQFWNVLRGDMSLVGPRPPLRYELEQYRGWHWRRVLEAKPGITGLWQVFGRSRTTFDEMVRLDLRYARTRSLRTDIRILLATPRAVMTGKGAC